MRAAVTEYFVDPVAEQKVLGSIIASGGGVLRDLDLTVEDFAGGAHAELWRAIHGHLETGKPLTPELLLAYVREHGRATQLAPVIVECLSGVAVPSEAAWHAVGLRTLTARRRLQAAQTAIGQVAATPDATPEELFEAARGQLDRFTERSVATGGAQTFADAYLEAMETWAKPDTNVLPTHWAALDEKLTGGLRPGHLCIVGARPAIGKSLMATELARQVASRGGVTLLHSLEMTRLEVVNR
jgi:replicative DNA helicase